MASEDAVMSTNDDASQCKRYAVERKYWTDPYISLVSSRGQARHAPEISRGYYARVTAIRLFLHKFIKLTQKNCQVISLGAGFDTNYWLLKDLDMTPKSYVEMDFSTVTAKKVYQIKRHEILLQKLANEDGDIQISKSEIHGSDYHLVSVNLTNLEELKSKLSACGIDKSLPTVFISECVLVYIDFKRTAELLKWFSGNFTTALFLNYEQVNMTDKFGQVMIDNLKTRDCFLSGVEACSSLDTQKNRFLNQGWEAADGMDMLQVYKCLPQADLQRIERLEFMDERELLEQLLSHYCLVWAWIDPNNIGLADLDLT